MREIFFGLMDGDDRFMSTPAPSVILTSVNDFNLSVQFRAWLIDEHQFGARRAELREKVYLALRSNEIAMPPSFPSTMRSGSFGSTQMAWKSTCTACAMLRIVRPPSSEKRSDEK